ncbi:MAG TPA: aldo/keto reductase [Candidatus Methylomirabilis sp.]|nr:aldo/keto reductase [Candidatus Methylomirabilis sp.]
MRLNEIAVSRRTFLKSTCAISALMALWPKELLAAKANVIKRTIPSSGERLSVIGMGTSRTFSDDVSKEQLGEVMQTFFDHGGQLIDSSPMYGPAERLVGGLLKTTKNARGLFVATKVWTDGKQSGIEQMQRSMQLLGVGAIDLMQIHNLRDWKVHIHTLREWKAQGKIRYLGITTSHGSRHEEFETIMKAEQLDFVQFSYNLVDREAERRLFPIATEKGIATLINRPFQRGGMFDKVEGKKLPEWAAEFDCTSWAQFFLKFVVSHPQVTNVIPATSKVDHMIDNMGAGYGRLPDAKMRERMVRYLEAL